MHGSSITWSNLVFQKLLGSGLNQAQVLLLFLVCFLDDAKYALWNLRQWPTEKISHITIIYFNEGFCLQTMLYLFLSS